MNRQQRQQPLNNIKIYQSNS